MKLSAARIKRKKELEAKAADGAARAWGGKGFTCTPSRPPPRSLQLAETCSRLLPVFNACMSVAR
jgi:hypothetical protein